MAITTQFGDQNVMEPGGYSQVKSGIPEGLIAGASGNVFLIDTGLGAGFGSGAGINGTLANGKKALQSWTSKEDYQKSISGGVLWDIADLLWNPDPTGENKGIEKLFYLSTKTSTPAQIDMLFLNGSLTIKIRNEGLIGNAELSSSTLTKGYQAVLEAGTIDTSKFLIKIYKGTFRGLDENGLPFDNIEAVDSVSELVIQTPEMSTLAEMILWMTDNSDFKKDFYLSASSGTGVISTFDLNQYASTALAMTLDGDYLTPTTGFASLTPAQIATQIATYINAATGLSVTATVTQPVAGQARVVLTGKVGTGDSLNGLVPAGVKNGPPTGITLGAVVNMAGGVDKIQSINVAETRSSVSISTIGLGNGQATWANVDDGDGNVEQISFRFAYGLTDAQYAADLVAAINESTADTGYSAIHTSVGTVEQETVLCIADLATAEVRTIACIADAAVKQIDTAQYGNAAATAQGDYIVVYNTIGESFAIWMDKDAAGIAPVGATYTGADYQIEVEYVTGQTGTTIATNVKNTLEAHADWIAHADITITRSTDTLTFTQDYYGAATDIESYDAGGALDGGFATPLTPVDGVNSALTGKYFSISSPTINYYVWFTVDGIATASVDPAPAGKTAIPVTINAADSANTVADLVAAALDALAAFVAPNPAAATITATNAILGVATDAAANTSGFTIVTTIQGVNSNLSGKYFTLSSTTLDYYCWLDITGLVSASTDPAPAGKTEIQVTIAGGSTANQVADAVAAAIDALADFTAPNPAAATITVSDTVTGNVTNAADVDTGFTITVTQQGIATDELVTISAPVGTGATPNGYTANLTYIGVSGTFAGGVTQTYTVTTPETLSTGYITITAVTPGNGALAYGGTESYTSAGMLDVLEVIADIDNAIFLSTDFGDDALSVDNYRLQSHIRSDASYQNKLLVIGGGRTSSDFDQSGGSIDAAEGMNDENIVVVHNDVYITRLGNQKQYSSFYHAAAVAGRLAGLAPQTPLTWKRLAIDSPVDELTLKQRELALSKGVVHQRYVDGIGWVVNQGVNTLQKNIQLINPDGKSYEISIMRVIGQLNKEMKINTRMRFVGKNQNTASPTDLKNFIIGFLSDKIATKDVDNLIIKYFDIEVKLTQDYYDIKYKFIPNGPINKVFTTGFIVDNTISI